MSQNCQKKQITMFVRMWRKENPCTLLVGMQTGAATAESSMELPQKIKNGAALWPRNATAGNLSKETQNTNSKEHNCPYALCSVIYNHQDMEAAQVPISRWVDKTTLGYLHNGILPGHTKKKILPCVAWMDLENIMLSEISQSEKDKYHMNSLIYRI